MALGPGRLVNALCLAKEMPGDITSAYRTRRQRRNAPAAIGLARIKEKGY
jgi:hypothetical protein